jgi:hypothetical protein
MKILTSARSKPLINLHQSIGIRSILGNNRSMMLPDMMKGLVKMPFIDTTTRR